MRHRSASKVAASALTAALAVLPLGGCFWATSKREGEKLRRDVDALEKKVDDGLGGKVGKLEQVLADATKLLTRNSADLGAEVANLGEEQRRLNGLVLEAKRVADTLQPLVDKQEARLADLEQRIAAIESKTAAPPPRSAIDLWNEGQAAMNSGDFVKAELAFRTLVARFPGDDKADDAQFQRAESLARARQFDKALPEFQRVYDKYPTSPLADQALFRAGEVAQELRWCTDARAYFGLLRQKFPRSELAKKAKEKDAALKKIAADKKKCQS